MHGIMVRVASFKRVSSVEIMCCYFSFAYLLTYSVAAHVHCGAAMH